MRKPDLEPSCSLSMLISGICSCTLSHACGQPSKQTEKTATLAAAVPYPRAYRSSFLGSDVLAVLSNLGDSVGIGASKTTGMHRKPVPRVSCLGYHAGKGVALPRRWTNRLTDE